jgi:predicted nucleic acid-binding protein
VTTLLDTNVLIRHFTGDPPDQARRATAYLQGSSAGEFLLLDLITAEMVFVLQRRYLQPRDTIAGMLRSTLALPAVRCENEALLHRAIELYEAGAGWADAYLVATAEHRGKLDIASFDRGIPRVPDSRRVEPPEL